MWGWDACVARVLFLSLPCWTNTITPHPAGDPKGPPNPTSSSLAPTNHVALCLVSQNGTRASVYYLEHLQILIPLPVGDVGLEAGEFAAFDGREDLHKLVSQDAAERFVALECIERIVKRGRQWLETTVTLCQTFDQLWGHFCLFETQYSSGDNGCGCQVGVAQSGGQAVFKVRARVTAVLGANQGRAVFQAPATVGGREMMRHEAVVAVGRGSHQCHRRVGMLQHTLGEKVGRLRQAVLVVSVQEGVLSAILRD